MKIWVLCRKIRSPPRKNRHVDNSRCPYRFDRVNFCLTVEEDEDKVGNNLSANFLLRAKIHYQAMSEKHVTKGLSKRLTQGKVYKKTYV